MKEDAKYKHYEDYRDVTWQSNRRKKMQNISVTRITETSHVRIIEQRYKI